MRKLLTRDRWWAGTDEDEAMLPAVSSGINGIAAVCPRWEAGNVREKQF